MDRHTFPNGDSFEGDPLIELPGINVYLTAADSIYVFETGPMYDSGMDIATLGPCSYHPVEFDGLAHWLSDEELEQAAKNLEDLRRQRGNDLV